MIGLLTGCKAQQITLDKIEETKFEIVIETEIASETDDIIRIEINEEESLKEESNTEKQIPEILFAGDIYLSSHVLNAYDQKGIDGVLDDGFQQVIAQSDFFMLNQEFAFSNRGEQAPDKEYTFRLPTDRIDIFKEIGIDGVSLANNHALDFGVIALQDSIQLLNENQILNAGAGNSLEEAMEAIYVEEQGKKISILCGTRVIPVYEWGATKTNPGMLSTYDPANLVSAIIREKEHSDYVIVYVHWGIERATIPEEYQRNLAKQYIDAGADLVIGSHPHVLQGMEYYNEKPIIYSLGNFIFGSSIPSTALVQVEFAEQLKIKWIPGTSSNGYTNSIQDTQEQIEFYQYIESISTGVSLDNNGYASINYD